MQASGGPTLQAPAKLLMKPYGWLISSGITSSHKPFNLPFKHPKSKLWAYDDGSGGGGGGNGCEISGVDRSRAYRE